MTQKRKERHKETSTYQTPGNDPRASLKWPPLSAPFRGLPTAGQGGSASWSLYPGQLAKTGPGPAPRCGWSSSLAAPAETACPGGGGQWGWSQACLSKLSGQWQTPRQSQESERHDHTHRPPCIKFLLISLPPLPRPQTQVSSDVMCTHAQPRRRRQETPP